jgi:O-antigen/teichoic acid export membrane protein
MTRVQAEKRQATYAGLLVVEAALLLIGTGLALHLSPRVESYLLGQAAAMVGFLLIILIVDRQALGALRLWKPAPSPFPATLWRYGLPFAPMAVLTWLANLGDRYTVAALQGASSAGRYVAPFSIASRAIVVMNTALCDLFRPLLFDAANRSDRRETGRIFRRWIFTSIGLGLLAILGVLIAGNLAVYLLLAPAYREGAVTLMLWVVCGYAVSGLTQIFENRILSLGYSSRLLVPMVFGAVTNIGFSIVLVIRNGVLGAAQATCLSFVVQSLATLLVLDRVRARPKDLAMTEERKLDVA